MSLERYCHEKRMIILNPSASAYEAVRALENNHVGAVIVQDGRSVVGVATDRDLALRVMGRELDPRQTPLRDVMTPGPATLTPDESELQAATLMRARHVRRIPIVEDGRAVGIVTLDDLILSGAVDLEVAGDIIDAELAEPAPAKPAGVPHPIKNRAQDRSARRAARVEQKLRKLAARLQIALGLPDAEQALKAFVVVLQGLVRRMTPAEASDFVSQLPAGIQERLRDLPAGPDRSVSLETLEQEMAEQLNVGEERATLLVRQVAAVLPEFVTVGEFEQVVSQLPSDMKAVFALRPLP